MAGFKEPRTYLVGSTQLERDGLAAYLTDTGQEEFQDSVAQALMQGLHEGEVLASFSAKICYRSLVLGKNVNVTRTRDIKDNLAGCIQAGHSSVWGHVVCNFITTNCSRLFTHEIIRHEVGSEPDVPPLPLGLHEWSQTSGRYVRLDKIDVAWDPILEGCEDVATAHVRATEDLIYLLECRKGLRRQPSEGFSYTPEQTLDLRNHGLREEYERARWLPNDAMPFDRKKKLTSAIRRFAMNGQVNEIVWSANLRALRHMIQMRTGRHAEWEIRLVFGQVFNIVSKKFPAAFADARVTEVEGLPEVTGMKTQPYQEAPQ